LSGVIDYNYNFEWLAKETNYEIETDRSSKNDTNSKGSTFVFKTNGADVSIILRQNFSTPQEINIMYAFFVPFKGQQFTKTINFITGIFLLNKFNIRFKI